MEMKGVDKVKSILFNIAQQDVQNKPLRIPGSDIPVAYSVAITIPLLSAFSIEYVDIKINGVSFEGTATIKTEENKIEFQSDYKISTEFRTSIILYYHGIRDYELLFPWVESTALRKRIGYFHEEADKNFDSAAWFSFSIMCGAIFEGLLTAKGVNGDFNKKIDKAHEDGLLNENQKVIFHKVRKLRNTIHANNYNKNLTSRKDAMDIKNTLNSVIKSFASIS